MERTTLKRGGNSKILKLWNYLFGCITIGTTSDLLQHGKEIQLLFSITLTQSCTQIHFMMFTLDTDRTTHRKRYFSADIPWWCKCPHSYTLRRDPWGLSGLGVPYGHPYRVFLAYLFYRAHQEGLVDMCSMSLLATNISDNIHAHVLLLLFLALFW